MVSSALGATDLLIVVAGALLAGFTTGFAGFGTGLVASGVWMNALPAILVPPLVALASVAGQLVSFPAVRRSFAWGRAAPYLIGAAIGLPFGVAALSLASPDLLRLSIGGVLIAYSAWQIAIGQRWSIGDWGGRGADGAVGVVGGFMGGFAGLSGPAPLIWLQLRGGPSAGMRAVYQPFNLLVLASAAALMAVGGALTAEVLRLAALCLPATLIGAWLGARFYAKASEALFKRVVLALLLASGLLLVGQGMAG